MSTFRCEFLGCKVNQADAERARRHLQLRGFREVDDGARLVLVAGCTVTATAGRKGRQVVRGALRESTAPRVAVLGCVAPDDRRYYDSLGERVTFLPSARDDGFLTGLDQLADVVQPDGPEATQPLPPPRRCRAFLKVEDGCDLACSYCIIPSIRGKARSRAPDAVEADLRTLLAQGVREVVLTGIHLGHYGRRTEWTLAGLIRRLARVEGDWRLRISSLEASELRGEVLDAVAEEPRIVPHFHLPLQSGSRRVLRAMRRPYTPDHFRRAVRRIRSRREDVALTTDVIVGFPGETDAEFEETLEVCRDAAFSKIHVFPFSTRQGTHASTLGAPVHGDIVKQRKRQLFDLEASMRDASLARRVGRPADVVVETRTEGGWIGTTERYHRAIVRNAIQPGALVRGIVTSIEGGVLQVAAP